MTITPPDDSFGDEEAWEAQLAPPVPIVCDQEKRDPNDGFRSGSDPYTNGLRDGWR